jgi:hypothetical protein
MTTWNPPLMGPVTPRNQDPAECDRLQYQTADSNCRLNYRWRCTGRCNFGAAAIARTAIQAPQKIHSLTAEGDFSNTRSPAMADMRRCTQNTPSPARAHECRLPFALFHFHP